MEEEVGVEKQNSKNRFGKNEDDAAWRKFLWFMIFLPVHIQCWLAWLRQVKWHWQPEILSLCWPHWYGYWDLLHVNICTIHTKTSRSRNTHQTVANTSSRSKAVGFCRCVTVLKPQLETPTLKRRPGGRAWRARSPCVLGSADVSAGSIWKPKGFSAESAAPLTATSPIPSWTAPPVPRRCRQTRATRRLRGTLRARALQPGPQSPPPAATAP